MKHQLITILLFAVNLCAQANDLGQKTYDIACKNCHAPHLASRLAAPAAFDKKAWNARFKQAAIQAKKAPETFKTPIDYLLNSVKKGKHLMEHGGLCHEADIPNKDCSDEAYIQAIHYMSQR